LDVATDDEERRRRAGCREGIQHGLRAATVRAIVERERDAGDGAGAAEIDVVEEVLRGQEDRGHGAPRRQEESGEREENPTCHAFPHRLMYGPAPRAELKTRRTSMITDVRRLALLVLPLAILAAQPASAALVLKAKSLACGGTGAQRGSLSVSARSGVLKFKLKGQELVSGQAV